jgi:DNA-binding protein Fis
MNTLFQAAQSEDGLDVNSLIERETTRHAMAQCQGKAADAAKLLGITAAALRKRLIRYDLTAEPAGKGMK